MNSSCISNLIISTFLYTLAMSQQYPKQVPVDGVYYGTPILPHPVYPTRSRASSFFKFLVGFIVALVVAVLILWVVYRPTRMRVHVVGASITDFNLTQQNILSYNLELDMSLRNPNKRVGIYYDRLEGTASYEGERFGFTQLPSFYQGHKNTTLINVSFQGQNFVPLSKTDVERFENQKRDGYFFVDVKIYARIRFKVGSLKMKRYRPDFECDLRVPLLINGSASGRSFARTKCDVDF